MASAKGFDFYIFARHGTTVSWRIVEINRTETSGVATLNLPAATTLLTAGGIGKQCSSGSGNINTTRY
jgi:hypothetical protein